MPLHSGSPTYEGEIVRRLAELSDRYAVNLQKLEELLESLFDKRGRAMPPSAAEPERR